jgi:hypothetical protein
MAVILHLPLTTPVEHISDGLLDAGFDAINVKQVSATCLSPAEGTSTANLPLFLITLPKMSKSHKIFKLTRFCHTAIRVEYKAQTGLMQCYNCQKFGHVWANCKQPPHCMRCMG